MPEDKIQEKRFDDFKNEMFRALADLKETLGSRISELSGEVKAYMQMSQRQDRELVELRAKNENNEDDIREIKPKLEQVKEQTTELKTELETTQRNFKTALTIVSLGLSLLTLVLRFWKG
jgi:chromosome segregation ATPase